MWREQLGWTAARILLPSLIGDAVFAYLYAVGMLDGREAVVAAAALFAFTAAITLITDRWLQSIAGDATAGLGPDTADERSLPHRLNPAVRGLRLAALRLDRTWRRHAARADAELAAAEAVIAAVPDPLILIDRQRRIVRTNFAAADLIGGGAESRDLATALRNPLLLAGADAVLGGAPPRSVEFTLTAGVERVLRAHIARIDGPALHGAAAILTLHDVTTLRRGEQMRADFIANAGHELKTPLATLIGFIETLRGPARDDAVARERFLGIMQEQAQRMARLVNDLLSLSRIELNEHVAPTGRVSLAEIIDEVARGFELRAAERRMQLVCELPPDLPDVQGDRDELAQIFQNLFDNAVKYGRQNTRIMVTGRVNDRILPPVISVAVADSGDGIPGEHLLRLTERFYRVDTARSRELGGTGLGLAIVKHILNRHRGRLDIASTVGEGSTFTVSLRVADTGLPQALPDHSPRTAAE